LRNDPVSLVETGKTNDIRCGFVASHRVNRVNLTKARGHLASVAALVKTSVLVNAVCV
jgi:hypothetical protein